MQLIPCYSEACGLASSPQSRQRALSSRENARDEPSPAPEAYNCLLKWKDIRDYDCPTGAVALTILKCVGSRSQTTQECCHHDTTVAPNLFWCRAEGIRIP
eukprot:5290508-Amphidinium_carterae.2